MVACIGNEPVHGVELMADRFDAGVPEGMFGATLYQAAKDATMRQMILDFAAELESV